MTIKEVSIPSADGSFEIHGTLKTSPKSARATKQNKVPAVLIINGSGPIDRHGNVKMSGIMSVTNFDINTSNMLSDYLVNKQGMAVLTYDKRGIGKSISEKDPNLYYKAGVTDLVSDVVQAFHFLASDNTIDAENIFLLGHSEGAILLPLILKELKKENDAAVLPKGLVFLCGFGEAIRGAMEHQRETLVNEAKEQTGIKGWILRQVLTKERLEKQYNNTLQKIDDNEQHDYISAYLGLVKQPAKWMREHLALSEEDMQAELAKVDCHCLAIAGGNDRQVRSKFCEPTAAGELLPMSASLETHTLLHMTHVLRSMEDKPCHLLDATTEYPRLGKLPLEPELLSIIGKWCQGILSNQKSSNSSTTATPEEELSM